MFKVALLFASPLVIEQNENGKTVLKDKVYDQIDFIREFKWTKNNTFNEKIRYSKMCATMDNFTKMFSKQNSPTILHFSGHGERNTEDLQKMYDKLKNKEM